MKITTLDESTIQSIGHAFAYYDYGAEHGLIDAFPNREAVAAFICGYVRMALRGGILHATSEKHEGFIAYKLPGQKLSLRAMFETIFKDFQREKDVHISGLLADLMNQTPVTEADFAALAGKILLILPDQDFFSGKMQQDLIQLMHDPQITCVSGGHLSTVLKAESYIPTIRSFLQSLDA